MWLILESYNRRLDICKSCEKFDGTLCKVCGCFMKAKAAIPMSDCPEGKWDSNPDTQKEKPSWFTTYK